MTVPRALLVACGVTGPLACEAQAPLADVPFVLHQKAIIVELIANDRDTLRMLLDTGWGAMAFTDQAVARLNHSGPAGESRGWITLSSLSVQRLRKTSVPVETFRAADLTPLIGPHDGVLATDFFKDLVVQVDYPASRLRLFVRSPIPRNPSRGSVSVMPMVFSGSAGWLPFTDSVFVNGQQARGLFDTGGSDEFLAMPRLIDAQHLEELAEVSSARMGYFDGSPKRAPLRMARVTRVQVGRFVVDTPRVILAPPQLSGGNWGHDVVIGYGFLRNYVVTFDYPGRRVTLEGH